MDFFSRRVLVGFFLLFIFEKQNLIKIILTSLNLSQLLDISVQILKSTERGSFQWCPVTRPEAVCTDWHIGGPFEHQETLFHCGWPSILTQVMQRGCGNFLLSASQKPVDMVLSNRLYVTMLEKRGWLKWPPDIIKRGLLCFVLIFYKHVSFCAFLQKKIIIFKWLLLSLFF